MADKSKSTSGAKKRFSEEMITNCLQILESGDVEELFEIIPRIGVLRDARFHDPLIKLLKSKDPKRREFAAYSMGAMADKYFLESLKKAFMDSRKLKGFGANDLQIAIIEAIGAIGSDAAVEFFLPTLKNCCAAKADASKKSVHKKAARMGKWIIQSLGTIAQQGGGRCLEALIELTEHPDPEIKAQVLEEIGVAYWHRPNEVAASTLEKIYALTTHPESIVAESALSTLQNLADVGCKQAETYFSDSQEYED